LGHAMRCETSPDIGNVAPRALWGKRTSKAPVTIETRSG